MLPRSNFENVCLKLVAGSFVLSCNRARLFEQFRQGAGII